MRSTSGFTISDKLVDRIRLDYKTTAETIDNLADKYKISMIDVYQILDIEPNPNPNPTPNPEISFARGIVTSSICTRLELLPTEAMERRARRYELGIEQKGEDKAWNALSKNQNCLTDRKFFLNRIGHAMKHLNNLRDKLLSDDDDFEINGLGDDAAAIAWFADFACCATKMITLVREAEDKLPMGLKEKKNGE